MQINIAFVYYFFILMLSGSACFSQNLIGKVVDAQGKSAVQWVKVTNTKTQKFTYTDHEGHFNAFADVGDTLVFSLKNFHDKTTVVSSIPEGPLLIYLEFDAVELPEVFVMDKNENTSIRLHGIPEVDPNYEPIRPGRVSAGATDDSRPGITMAGPISFFSKSEKYKRKYREAEEVRTSQQNYLDVIHSDSMRNELKMHFSLNRAKYDSLLILFNATNRHHQFKDMEKERVEKMLFYFINNAVKN